MSRISLVVLVIIVLSALGLGFFLFLRYDVRMFSGDATIQDKGFWSYPRYWIICRKVSLSESGQHTFTMRGLPTTPLTFGLRVLGFSEGEVEKLRDAGVVVELRIEDEQKNSVCEISKLLSKWILAKSAIEGTFWDKSCRDRTFRRGATYTITLEVTVPDKNLPKVFVEPILSGGGNELP